METFEAIIAEKKKVLVKITVADVLPESILSALFFGNICVCSWECNTIIGDHKNRAGSHVVWSPVDPSPTALTSKWKAHRIDYE